MNIELYKRNANGNISVWSIIKNNENNATIIYGVLGKTLHHEQVLTNRDINAEITSRINVKRKEGYKSIEDVYDNSPIDTTNFTLGEKIQYLDTYLPKFNTTSDGFILPMLAKTLEDNKPFEKYGCMYGQWKINGLRCIVGAEKNEGDMFNPIRLTYTSREGTKWSLSHLDDVIIPIIRGELLDMMIEEGVCLDGELYLPGCSVNQINSYVKNSSFPEHYQLQYWCYDLCIDTMFVNNRYSILEKQIYPIIIQTKEEHLNHKEQFVLLPNNTITDISDAIKYRDKFIDLGFEGLITRIPTSEYAFGKRTVKAMYKFKKKEDGLFIIRDIVPEGKRTNLPKFVCQNDLNDEYFECTINQPQSVQETYLINKDKYVGKKLLVEFRERSGIKEVPFHAKGIKIVD